VFWRSRQISHPVKYFWLHQMENTLFYGKYGKERQNFENFRWAWLTNVSRLVHTGQPVLSWFIKFADSAICGAV
jgi:hypothetical protein